MDGTHSNDLLQSFNKAASQAAQKRTLHVDVEKYQHLLDGSGMDDTQKQEVLEALWSIIISFVDLGFGVHPVQQACGQVENGLDPRSQIDSDGVSSEETNMKDNNDDAPDRN